MDDIESKQIEKNILIVLSSIELYKQMLNSKNYDDEFKLNINNNLKKECARLNELKENYPEYFI